jgi:hypothetical protein
MGRWAGGARMFKEGPKALERVKRLFARADRGSGSEGEQGRSPGLSEGTTRQSGKRQAEGAGMSWASG